MDIKCFSDIWINYKISSNSKGLGKKLIPEPESMAFRGRDSITKPPFWVTSLPKTESWGTMLGSTPYFSVGFLFSFTLSIWGLMKNGCWPPNSLLKTADFTGNKAGPKHQL